MRLSSLRICVLAIAFAVLTPASPALAAWPHSAGSPLLLTNIPKLNTVVDAAVPDGSGGAYVFWEGDNGGDKNLYANHVLGTGVLDPAWPTVSGFGVFICNAAGDQIAVKAQLDGSNGIWLCWNDNRTGTPHNFVTRLLTNGTLSPAFPANGLQLASDTTQHHHAPQITSDGGTGLIAVWEYETSPTDHDIVGAHVTAAGVNDWSAALTNGPAVDSAPSLMRDGTVFEVGFMRSPTSAMFGVFNPLSGAQVGALVFLSNNAVPSEPVFVCPDGFGGEYAAWMEDGGGTDWSPSVNRLFAGVVTNSFGPVGYSTAADPSARSALRRRAHGERGLQRQHGRAGRGLDLATRLRRLDLAHGRSWTSAHRECPRPTTARAACSRLSRRSPTRRASCARRDAASPTTCCSRRASGSTSAMA